MAGLGEAALAYAGRLEWAVFPCHGKAPAIRGGSGHLDATTDLETIRAYWARYPRANIGVSCIASGLVALDVDPRSGGDETLAELESRYGRLPTTVRQTTGGGGEHILFRQTRDVHLRGSVGPGIDIKWRGSIVVSPSIHPDTGRRYQWQAGHHPIEVMLASPPTWLGELLASRTDPSCAGQAQPSIEEDAGWGPKPRYSRAALQRACEAIDAAPVGQQDATLNREAYWIGTLIGAGLMPRRLAIDCLVYSGTMMTNAPGRRRWQEREIQQKVVRAIRKGELHPREVA